MESSSPSRAIISDSDRCPLPIDRYGKSPRYEENFPVLFLRLVALTTLETQNREFSRPLCRAVALVAVSCEVYYSSKYVNLRRHLSSTSENPPLEESKRVDFSNCDLGVLQCSCSLKRRGRDRKRFRRVWIHVVNVECPGLRRYERDSVMSTRDRRGPRLSFRRRSPAVGTPAIFNVAGFFRPWT